MSLNKTDANLPPVKQMEGVTAEEDDPQAWTEEDEVNLKREKSRFILKLALLPCMVLLGIASCWAIATGHWWWAAAGLWGCLGVRNISNQIGADQFRLAYLPTKPPEIEPGVEAEFWGFYHPHWEIETILILKGYRFFGVLPIFERWMPSVAAPSLLPPGAPSREGPWPHYWMHFRGVPSEKGRFGHMGMNRRRVHVTAVMESGLIPDGSKVWT
ncbi:hypothetical protein [Prosthecobacter sp.]